MASRAKLASANIIFGLISNFVTIVLGFVSRAVFIQVLGAELLGIEAVFTSLIQMLSLADLGLMSVMTFSYYEPLAKNDRNQLKALTCFYRKLYCGIALVIAVLGTAIIPFLPYIVNTSTEIPNLLIFYLLFLADTVISYLFVYRTTILRADQKNFIVARYQIITSIARTISQIIVLLLTANYVLYLLVRIASTILWNFLSARKATKDYSDLFSEKVSLSHQNKIEILDIIKSGLIYKISSVFLTSTTNVVLSIAVGAITVGYLANYNLIATSVVQLEAIVFTNLIASIGNLVVLENAKTRFSVFKSMMAVASWLTVVLVTCTTVLCHSFIILWVGGNYTLPLETEVLRMAWMFFECIMQPIFSYREAVGLYRKTKYVMLVAAIINVVFGLTLGYIWGINGVLAAAILSRVLTYFWFEPKILFKDYFQLKPGFFFRSVLLAFIATAFCTLVGIVAIGYVPNLSWSTWIIEAAIIFIGTNFICALIFWRRPEIQQVLKTLKSLLHKTSSLN